MAHVLVLLIGEVLEDPRVAGALQADPDPGEGAWLLKDEIEGEKGMCFAVRQNRDHGPAESQPGLANLD